MKRQGTGLISLFIVVLCVAAFACVSIGLHEVNEMIFTGWICAWVAVTLATVKYTMSLPALFNHKRRN